MNSKGINKNEALKTRLSGYNPDDDIEDWEEDDEQDDEYEDDLDETEDNGEDDDFNSEGDWEEDAWSEKDLNQPDFISFDCEKIPTSTAARRWSCYS